MVTDLLDVISQPHNARPEFTEFLIDGETTASISCSSSRFAGSRLHLCGPPSEKTRKSKGPVNSVYHVPMCSFMRQNLLAQLISSSASFFIR